MTNKPSQPNSTKLSDRRVVVFIRKDGFYSLELPFWEDLARHAERNPGTLRIQDIEGNTLWQPQ